MKKFMLFVLFSLSVNVMAGNLTFIEAKAKADAVEESLASPELQKVIEAQGKVANSAFPKCINSTGSMPSDFTVVVSVDSTGKVISTWRKGKSPFAKCFENSMRQKFKYIPKIQYFYTSFEYMHET